MADNNNTKETLELGDEQLAQVAGGDWVPVTLNTGDWFICWTTQTHDISQGGQEHAFVVLEPTVCNTPDTSVPCSEWRVSHQFAHIDSTPLNTNTTVSAGYLFDGKKQNVPFLY